MGCGLMGWSRNDSHLRCRRRHRCRLVSTFLVATRPGHSLPRLLLPRLHLLEVPGGRGRVVELVQVPTLRFLRGRQKGKSLLKPGEDVFAADDVLVRVGVVEVSIGRRVVVVAAVGAATPTATPPSKFPTATATSSSSSRAAPLLAVVVGLPVPAESPPLPAPAERVRGAALTPPSRATPPSAAAVIVKVIGGVPLSSVAGSLGGKVLVVGSFIV